jgi:hypothetical protein
MKNKALFAAMTIVLTLPLTGCTINFEALLRPFASDVDACDQLSEVIETAGDRDESYEVILQRISQEVTPLAEPELAEALRLLTNSASNINNDGSIFQSIGAALVSTEQIGYVLNRCIEVGVEVQYGR